MSSLILIAGMPTLGAAMPCAVLLEDSPDFEEMRRLLTAPEASQFPYSTATDWGRDLVKLLARYVPVEGGQRASFLTVIAPNLATRIDLGGSNRNFTFDLTRSLALAQKLNIKDEHGRFLLLRALVEPRSPAKDPRLTEEARAEIASLIAQMPSDPLKSWGPDHNRLSEFVAPFVSADADRRAARTAEIFGVDFATSLVFTGNALTFSHTLLARLRLADKLKALDRDGQPLLFRYLESKP